MDDCRAEDFARMRQALARSAFERVSLHYAVIFAELTRKVSPQDVLYEDSTVIATRPVRGRAEIAPPGTSFFAFWPAFLRDLGFNFRLCWPIFVLLVAWLVISALILPTGEKRGLEMKGVYKRILPLILLVTFPTGSAWSGDSTFARWWSQFQAAAAHNDKEPIAGMIKFPLEWENLQMRSIQTKEEFLKRFPEIFTPEIKMKIAHLKPRKEEDGYSINWRGRGERAANSYSMFFKAARGGQFTIGGLYEGPAN
jgi:hypothetical protein